VRVRVWQGSRVVVELVVGKVDAGGTFVRPADGDQVWRVGGELRDTFDKSATEWRNRAVTRFDQDQARELAVTARDGAQIVLRRKPDELVSVHASVPGFGGLSHARWEVREASVRIDKLDEIVPREVVATLASLDASSFADDLPPSAAGLDPAVLTVRVALGDGQGDRDDPRARAVTIAIGDDAGADETFVKVVGAPQIYRVKRFNVERVNRRPIQFRDKTLCNISDQDVVAFGVVRGGESYAVERRAEGWKATQPSGMVVDPEKVAPLASVFRGWNAPAIAENAPARGDGAPRMVISGRSKDKTCTISVGDEAPNAAGYFVRTATSSDTYVVPKWMVDRIAVPLDDLRKS